MITLITACVISLGLLTIDATKFVSDIVDVYEVILREKYNKTIVDVEAMKLLINQDDSHPRCFKACEDYLESFIGRQGISFKELKLLVDKIYDGMISDDPYEPQEIHLALTSEATNINQHMTSMNVMWTTMDYLIDPFVEYKLLINDVDDWTSAVTTSAINYTYTVPQKWWPIFTGVIYKADMTDLQPDTVYSYRVGGYDLSNQTMRYSKVFSFTSTPLSSPDRKTVITTLADHGTFELFGCVTVQKIYNMFDDINMDLVFVAGDLSYAGLDASFKPLDISSDDEFEMIWDLLFIQNQPIAARVPWMVGVGNHESFYDYQAYINRYSMPSSKNIESNGNFWYDFDYGNVHWISISSEHPIDVGTPQRDFFEQALTAANMNREQVPWIVVSLHKPVYCSDISSGQRFASLLEDLLIEYDVDMTLTGHLHAYERIHPVRNGVVTSYPVKNVKLLKSNEDIYYSTGNGPVHVVQGNSGGLQEEKWQQPQPDWSAVRFANGYAPRNVSSAQQNSYSSIETGYDGELIGDIKVNDIVYSSAGNDYPSFNPDDKKLPFNYTNTFGFGIFTTYNRTHAYYQAIANTASKVGTDSFWIIKRI